MATARTRIDLAQQAGYAEAAVVGAQHNRVEQKGHHRVNMIIRPERVSDYGDIANLNYDAFVDWHPAAFKAEPLLVDVLRHNAMFDPELSLVAEHEGRIVGHVLFSPFEFVVLGTRQVGTLLAPLCVQPEYQRTGIGGMLIEKGHKVAREKGYGFSMLCGHPAYYPRFGYMQRMFALSGAKVTVTARGGRPGDLAERPVLSSDVEWIVDAWRQLHGGDDLALFPGNGIGQWFNHAVSHRSSVITRGGEAAAYVRYKRSCPISIKELLVREAKAGDILAFLLGEHCGESTGELALSLSEDALKTLFAPTDGVRVTGNLGTSDAFMLRILDEGNRVISRYCSDVSEARMPAGIVVFPAILDVDE